MFKAEVFKNYFLGIGGAGNYLLNKPETTISDHSIEIEALIELTRRFGNDLEVSLQYARGISKLAEVPYLNTLTQEEGIRKFYSRSFYLNLLYRFNST